MSPELNSFCIASRLARTFASSAGWLASQSFWGASRMRAPFAPPRLSPPRKVEAEAQAVDTSCETLSFEARIVALRAAMSFSSISLKSTFGIGSSQMSSAYGTSGPR